MHNAQQATPMIFAVKYCAYIRKQMEAILFLMVICLQKELPIQGRKYIPWGAAILTGSLLTRLPQQCIGVKWAQMPVTILKTIRGVTMNSTRQKNPVTMAGLILLATASLITILILLHRPSALCLI